MEVKTSSFRIYLILLLKVVFLATKVHTDDVFGCGGFIKSHADIDFSKVEIKLLTKQGSVKDKTDCSPSNGYYFIPVYDKGEYVIRVAPPPGWSFEPEQFEINFDGKTDLCSLGKDVNFNFKGFGITGKVGITNQDIGAKGVRIGLKSEDGQERHSISDKNGIFEFTPVVPGKYILKASHDRWSFSKAEYTVFVKTGNTEIPENSLLVSGFDVHGKIMSDGQPFKNVDIALFQMKTDSTQLTSNECKVASDSTIKLKEHEFFQLKPSCIVESTNSGEYIFSAISPGKYMVKPFFKDQKTKYHVRPDFVGFQVTNDGVFVKDNFEVTGFDVLGRVLASHNGKGVANAEIKLNGEVVTVSHTDGSYILENIKPGTFTIQVTAASMEFADHTVKISATNPSLPEIVVSAFKVCGQVISEQSHTVAITKHTSTFQTNIQTTPKSGEWCTFLANGKYSIEVLLRDEDHNNGIQFFPLSQEFDVSSVPLSGIVFSQLRATVTGQVKCLADADSNCKHTTITMHPLDGNANNNRLFLSTELKDGKYVFNDVLPGNYEVTISAVASQQLCWENKKFKLTVKTSQETVPTFVHTGYSISIVSSHKTEFTYKLRTSEPAASKPISTTLNAGLNQFCVPNSGVYEIKFAGCHTFDSNTPNSFNTQSTSPVTVTASKHRNGIRILSEEQTNYNMLVNYSGGRKDVVTLREEKDKVDGYHSYIHIFDLGIGDTVKFIPQSDHMLFKPETKEVIGGNDCVDVVFSFIATKGLVLNGNIIPAIGGAKITLSFPKNPELESFVTESTDKGEFRFGPIDSNIDYEIMAEKESYVFTDFDKTSKLFKAHKLCEIVVTIRDDGGEKLPGVLISLSGGESYRKNLITGDDGVIKFHSLSPSQYYLRPMMKEYKFEPASKMIDVKDGDTAIVELNGKRVAYSAYGQVTYLNGEPFNNVLVEAVSVPNSQCAEHQEESSSEANGHFRIRGLQPGCNYIVQLKEGEINELVDRSIPLQTTISIISKDVKNLNIVAISPLGFVDVIARITASQNDYYKTLRIQMFKKGSGETPVYTQKVESPLNLKSKINPGIMVFFPRIPLDGKAYYIEISTTLSDKNFKYVLPTAQFIANTSSIYAELDFKPEVRTTENDLNQNSISALLLIAIVGLVFFKQELALEILTVVWTKVSGAVQDVIDQNRKKEVAKYDRVVVDDNEIEQLAQSINAVKKKKTRKSN